MLWMRFFSYTEVAVKRATVRVITELGTLIMCMVWKSKYRNTEAVQDAERHELGKQTAPPPWRKSDRVGSLVL